MLFSTDLKFILLLSSKLLGTSAINRMWLNVNDLKSAEPLDHGSELSRKFIGSRSRWRGMTVNILHIPGCTGSFLATMKDSRVVQSILIQV